jgi:hypothetical protein
MPLVIPGAASKQGGAGASTSTVKVGDSAIVCLVHDTYTP